MATWNIRRGKERNRVLLPEGESECVLTHINNVVAQDKFNGGEREMLVFSFAPTPDALKALDVELKAGEEASINKWVTPNSHEKSNLSKLIVAMSEVGEFKEEYRDEDDAFQAFVESFVGRVFMIHHKAGEKSNYPVTITRIPGKNKGKEFNYETWVKNKDVPGTSNFDDDNIPF